MTKDDLLQLERLSKAATPAPWHVCFSDDDMCMSMVAVATTSNIDDHDASRDADKIIAATLVQYPRYAVVTDGHWDENAELIASIRNRLPELIALARKALDANSDDVKLG